MDEGRLPHLKPMQAQKTLLLSATVPGTAHVGEIILADIVRRLGPENVHCVALVAPKHRNQPDPELARMGLRTIVTDHLDARRRHRNKWGAAESLLKYWTGFRVNVGRTAQEIVTEGERAGITQVFAVLNNPLMFALAHRVAARLQVPLLTLVWDPPEYLLRIAAFDRWSRRSLLNEFRRCLAKSQRVAVVSEAMQRYYAEFTDAPIQILRHGLPVPEVPESKSCLNPPSNEWLIGFAGSMYASDAWMALLNALDQADWRVAGRPVRIRMLTGNLTINCRRGARIDYFGFRSPDEAQDILSGCHLTYLPQPFSPAQRDLCQFAFPTKLANYLTLGRPVFVHAPSEGALSEFIECNLIGVQADSLEPAPILAALEQVFSDTELHREISANVIEVARRYFDQSVFHAAVDRLLGTTASVHVLGQQQLSLAP